MAYRNLDAATEIPITMAISQIPFRLKNWKEARSTGNISLRRPLSPILYSIELYTGHRPVLFNLIKQNVNKKLFKNESGNCEGVEDKSFSFNFPCVILFESRDFRESWSSAEFWILVPNRNSDRFNSLMPK